MDIMPSAFLKIFEEKYNKKMPVYRFLYHFPDLTFEQLEEVAEYCKLKIHKGYITE